MSLSHFDNIIQQKINLLCQQIKRINDKRFAFINFIASNEANG